jgi:putative heme-binding domain-containing protein
LDNPFTAGLDVRTGGRLFLRQCSRCHGQDAKGSDETGAPDLTTGRFANASTPTGVFNVIRNGVDGTAMLPISPTSSDQSVWQLVAYIDSLNAALDVDLPGNPSAGRQVYEGKGACARCHMENGNGARLGPDLSRVGERRDPDELASDLVDPDEDVNPRWWTLHVTRADGSVIEGFRMGEDTFSLRLMDQDENLWSFSKNEIRSYERIETSTMPSYDETLTSAEMDDLVAYLFSLRKETSQ